VNLGELQMAVRTRKRELLPFKENEAERKDNGWYAYLAKRRLMDAALIAEQHGLNLGRLAADLEKELR
jgi:hypothetical protein